MPPSKRKTVPPMSPPKNAPRDPTSDHLDGPDSPHAHRARAGMDHVGLDHAGAEALPTAALHQGLASLDSLVEDVHKQWLTPGEDWGHEQLEAFKLRSRQLRDQGLQARHSAERYVRAQPFTALAWAAAVGAVLVALPLWWRRSGPAARQANARSSEH